MKKLLIFSGLILLFYSCTPLQNQNVALRHPTQTVPVREEVKKLPQSDFYVSDSGVSYLLDVISADVSKASRRYYNANQLKSTLESYVGETVIIDSVAGNRLEIVSAPKVQSFDFYLRGGTITFKSLCQGEYIAEVYNGTQFVSTVRINNKLKYKFTEKENYDIISKAYIDKDFKKLRDSISLYRISFPGSSKDKELSFMLIEIATLEGQTSVVKEEMSYLNSNYQLNESETITSNLNENKENELVALKEDSITPTEILPNKVEEVRVSPAQFGKNFEDGKRALDQSSYAEALVLFEKAKVGATEDEKTALNFYLGKVYYMSGDYNSAKLSLQNVKDIDQNMAEANYYLGVIAHKEGNISKAKDYLNKSRNNNPSSTWGRKSSIYLMKL